MADTQKFELAFTAAGVVRDADGNVVVQDDEKITDTETED